MVKDLKWYINVHDNQSAKWDSIINLLCPFFELLSIPCLEKIYHVNPHLLLVLLLPLLCDTCIELPVMYKQTSSPSFPDMHG